MARPGVTYVEVAEAASHLLGKNKNPTIEQVRLLLGTGSSTTIANHLKQWRDEQKSTSLIAAKENIPQELIAMLKGLWERVIEQSEMKVGVIETSYERTIAELQQEVQKYKTNNQRWQQLFNQWQQEKAQLTNDKLAFEKAVETLKNENSVIQSKHDVFVQQLQEKQERIHELHRLHTQAQANLEHYRESAREQRLVEQQQFEQQKQEWQAEIKILKEQVTAMREKTSSLQQQYQTLQQDHAMQEKNYAQAKEKLENQQLRLDEVEKAKNEHLQASLHWQNQYKETQKSLDAKVTQFADTQAEAKVLSQQLSDTRQSLTDAFDQNKLLGHEKWILAQEKAHLEGQLKQKFKVTDSLL